MTTDPATPEEHDSPAPPTGAGEPSPPPKAQKKGTKAEAGTPPNPAGEPPPPGNPDRPKKATNAVVARRVEEVLRIRLDGATFADIRDYADDPARAWGLSDSQLKRYIEKSDALLRARTEKSRGNVTRLHLARREALFGRAVAAADFRTALAVLDSEAKLRGLYASDAEVREVRKLAEDAARALAEVQAVAAENERLRAQLGLAAKGDGTPPATEAAPDPPD